MHYRYTHAFKSTDAAMGEPSDLPSVIREDMLMIAPITPWQLFATWHISYSTQNRLRDYIGEEEFDNCRLMLTLKMLDNDLEGLSIDVSGPSTTTYINLENLSSTSRAKLLSLTAVHIYGELSYHRETTSYYVTRSGLISLPRAYLSNRSDPDFPPIPALYSRIFRRLVPQAAHDDETLSLVLLGEQLDTQLGISAL